MDNEKRKDDETILEDKISTSLASLDILNNTKLLKVALKSKSSKDLETSMTKMKTQFEEYKNIHWDNIDWDTIFKDLREEVVDDEPVIDESEDELITPKECNIEDTDEVSENANVVGGGMSPTASNTVEDTEEEVVEDTEEVVEDTEEVVEDTEEVVEDISVKLTAEDIDTSEDTDALLSGHDFSDEYKEKVKGIYETAVLTKINEHIELIESKYKEKYDSELSTVTENMHIELIEDMNKYLTYAVEEWVTENKIAIESGIKSSILENFISGLKDVFETNYIDIPTEKLDIYEESKENEKRLESELNIQIEKNIKLTEQIMVSQRDAIINKLTEGLTLTQTEKVKKLSENLEFSSVEKFNDKINIIIESYFSKEDTLTESNILEETALDTAIEDSPIVKELNESQENSVMTHYTSTLSRCK